MSRLEWPMFQLTMNKSWCTARVSTVFSLVYKHLPEGLTSKVNFLLMILPYLALQTVPTLQLWHLIVIY